MPTVFEITRDIIALRDKKESLRKSLKQEMNSVEAEFRDLKDSMKDRIKQRYKAEAELINAEIEHLKALLRSPYAHPIIWDLGLIKSSCLEPLLSRAYPKTIGIKEGQAEELRKEMIEVIGTLALREQSVLIHRFGLDGTGMETLDQTKVRFGVTRERIRQIEAKALRKLLHPTRAGRIKKYLVEEGE